MVSVRNPLRNPLYNNDARNVPNSVKKPNVTTSPASTPVPVSAADSGNTADFRSLFGSVNTALLTPDPHVEPAKPAIPTIQSMFGGSPYVSNPGGIAPNGVTYGYNPTYFATRSAAAILAQRYGGTVVEMNAITPYGPFQQNQMNEMIRFSNGNVVNAGILASYYDRGWTQDQIDSAIAQEINQIPG